MPPSKRATQRERRAIAAVACPTCGAALGEYCRDRDGSPRILAGRPLICADRRKAWQMIRDGEITNTPRTDETS